MSSDKDPREEQIRIAQERIKQLKELTLKMGTPQGLAELEKESAWQRKMVTLTFKNIEPLKLYFNLSEFTATDIANAISHLSSIYNSIGGDELEIIGMRNLELKNHRNLIEI